MTDQQSQPKIGDRRRGVRERPNVRRHRNGSVHKALPGRHGLRRHVAEQDALAELPSEVVSLIADLHLRGWEINHGGHQTHLVFARHGVGGINRKWGFGYLSKLIGPVMGDDHLKALGFKLKEVQNPKSAYFGHRWYSVPLPIGLAALRQALTELEQLVRSECEHE